MEAKDFIYLDTDYLKSYVAQVNKGLLRMKTSEEERERQEQSTRNGEQVVTKTTGAGAIGIAGISYGREITHEYGGYLKSVTETEKQLMEYELHDDMYEMFFSNADDEGRLQKNVNNPVVGKYIEVAGGYELIDLEMYRKIFTDEFIMKQLPTNTVSEIKNSEIINIIDSMALLLPTMSYLAVDKYIVPIKTQFLRESFKEIMFKYSGKINVVGKVTAPFVDVKTSVSPEADLVKITSSIYSSTKGLLASVGFTNARFILSPIAVYF